MFLLLITATYMCACDSVSTTNNDKKPTTTTKTNNNSSNIMQEMETSTPTTPHEENVESQKEVDENDDNNNNNNNNNNNENGDEIDSVLLKLNYSSIDKKNEFLNPRVFNVLEQKTRMLSESFVHLLGGLQSALHATSTITKQHVEVYQESVFHTCDTIDNNVRIMEQFAQKCEELNEHLKLARIMHSDIKKLKNAVEALDIMTQDLNNKRLR
jgi:hypothetical protein